MKKSEKNKITKICKEFFEGMKGVAGHDTIEGSGWVYVDPMSGYLNSIGIENTLVQLPKTEERNQILILNFPDGSSFIPAGADLKFKFPDAENWLWL